MTNALDDIDGSVIETLGILVRAVDAEYGGGALPEVRFWMSTDDKFCGSVIETNPTGDRTVFQVRAGESIEEVIRALATGWLSEAMRRRKLLTQLADSLAAAREEAK
jgi:hypothetical protein